MTPSSYIRGGGLENMTLVDGGGGVGLTMTFGKNFKPFD